MIAHLHHFFVIPDDRAPRLLLGDIHRREDPVHDLAGIIRREVIRNLEDTRAGRQHHALAGVLVVADGIA